MKIGRLHRSFYCSYFSDPWWSQVNTQVNIKLKTKIRGELSYNDDFVSVITQSIEHIKQHDNDDFEGIEINGQMLNIEMTPQAFGWRLSLGGQKGS